MNKNKFQKGMVQIYAGKGKGKTTAALGLGLRAAGRGLRVKMVQFLKGSDSGELYAVNYPGSLFEILRFEKNRGFYWTLTNTEKKELEKEIHEAWRYIQQIMVSGECEVLILDEILVVIENNLLSLDELLNLIKNRPDNMELVLTGTNLPPQLVDVADLITVMNEVKHYFHSGAPARWGIEY